MKGDCFACGQAITGTRELRCRRLLGPLTGEKCLVVSFPAGYHTRVEPPLARCAAMRAQVHDSQQVPLNDSSRTSPINIQAAAVWTSTVTPQSHLLHRSTSLPVRILLDRRTGESNQDSLVSVRMKFCSALRSSEVEIFRFDPRRAPGSLFSERPSKWRNLLGFQAPPYS